MSFSILKTQMKKIIPNLNQNMNIYYKSYGNILSSNKCLTNNYEQEALLDIGIIMSCCPNLSSIFIANIENSLEIKNVINDCLNNDIYVISISFGDSSLLPDNQKNIIKYFGNIDNYDDFCINGLQNYNNNENYYPDQYKKITICVSAGDNSGRGFSENNKSVNYPSASKYVLSCGGTELYQINNNCSTSNTKLKNEIIWGNSNKNCNGTGGGITPFKKPIWQNNLNFNNRVTPDVSGIAQNFNIPLVNRYLYENINEICVKKPQVYQTYGGTSAVAPFYAAFFVLVNQNRKLKNKNPIGFINDILYENKNLFNTIKQGNNNFYSGEENYLLATGLGSPKFNDLYSKLINL